MGMPQLPRVVEAGLVGFSLVMFVGTLLAIPWLVRRLPADHFVRPAPRRSLAARIGRNAVGALLVAVGVAMLVLPGQGVVTILVGLSIMDLGIKHRVLRWLLTRPKVQEGVQRLRAKAGKPPLVIPEDPIRPSTRATTG